MGIKTILSEIKTDQTFKESLPNINSDEFDKVILTRRSVRVFTDEDIPKDIINNSKIVISLSHKPILDKLSPK